MIPFENIIRLIAIIMLAFATAAMIRFYLSQDKMPWGGFVGVASATVVMAGTVIEKFNDSFQWWATPFVIIYSAGVIYGTRRFLVWRR
jgi:hypothetical protein